MKIPVVRPSLNHKEQHFLGPPTFIAQLRLYKNLFSGPKISRGHKLLLFWGEHLFSLTNWSFSVLCYVLNANMNQTYYFSWEQVSPTIEVAVVGGYCPKMKILWNLNHLFEFDFMSDLDLIFTTQLEARCWNSSVCDRTIALFGDA